MDEFDRVRSMLDAANASFNDANARGDSAAAHEIETALIDPLKSALAGLALSDLSTHANQIRALSGKLEAALRTLQRRIDRMFVDRLIEKARELDLAHLPVAPPPRPALPTEAEGPAVEAAPAGQVIDIKDKDLDALQRVAHSESGHFGKYGEAQLRGGLAAVVDTILNRAAHPRWPDTIQEVVDQPRQFSAINETGSWTGLPPATPNVARIVEEHVDARAAGGGSEIGGATHFLNPYLSSASALAAWGNDVVRNAVAVYGSEEKKDVHYHGFAPGTPLPPPYVVARNERASRFDSVGRSPGGPVSNTDLRNAIVRICHEELARFDDGKAKETDDPQYLRVGDYWRAVGQPMDGRTVDAEGARPAWSAAFISFVLKEAGAGDRFKYSVAHCHYFQDFVDRAGPALYEAVPTDDVVPAVGDIVHYGRDEAAQYGFAKARADYASDSFYKSHASIVVAVDHDAGVISTVGGNERDSVKLATYQLDENGHIKPRRRGNKRFPWIGILRLT